MKPFLYHRLHASLLLELAGGHYAPDDRFLSLREIAERFGASKPTANGVQKRLLEEGFIYTRPRSGTFVAHGAREQAMLALSEGELTDGPLPHTWKSKREKLRLDAGALRPRHIMVLYNLQQHEGAMMLPVAPGVSFLRASRGCLEAARVRDAEATLVIHDGSEARQQQVLEWMEGKDLGGVMIVQRGATFRQLHEIVDPLLAAGLPVVNLFGDTQGADITNVDFNNVAGGFAAAMRMIEAGHQKLTILQVEGSTQVATLLRTEGIRLAAQKRVELEVIAISPHRWREEMPRLFERKPWPEAIISLTHDFALQVLEQAQGVAVPGKDFSLIAFSSTSATPYNLELDIIKLDFDRLGAAGMDLLLDAMEGKEIHQTLLIPMTEEHHGTVVGYSEAVDGA